MGAENWLKPNGSRKVSQKNKDSLKPLLLGFRYVNQNFVVGVFQIGFGYLTKKGVLISPLF
jgi:hypothetical protein